MNFIIKAKVNSNILALSICCGTDNNFIVHDHVIIYSLKNRKKKMPGLALILRCGYHIIFTCMLQ
jgi:hypothetical protein